MFIIIYRGNKYIKADIMIYAIKEDVVLPYENITECSKDLNLDGVLISECLLNKKFYNGWEFISELAVGFEL